MNAQTIEHSYAMQPIMDLATRTPLYHEMLIRFADGRPVQEAIIEAETERNIGVIDFWVLRQAITLLEEDEEQGMLAVNLSPVTIELGYEKLLSAFAESPAVKGRLLVEITETAPMLEPKAIRAFIDGAYANEIKIALDDYGCGYCDAARAMQVKPNYIKIAKQGRNGWKQMPQREWDALQEYCAELNIELVCEGVESEHELLFAAAMGFPYAQGFFFSRPIVIPSVRERLVVVGGAR